MAEINMKNMYVLYNKYRVLIKESNSMWPHPEKIQSLKELCSHSCADVLREKYFSYCIFYDRSPVEILKMSDDDIGSDLQDKVIEYCAKTTPHFLLRSHEFAGKYYIQSFICMAYDYNINLDMDKCEQGALVPRNFFRILRRFREIYTVVNREVKSKLGEIEYFTDDLSNIVISYIF